MEVTNFLFTPENVINAQSFTNRAVCFTYHEGYNLNDGDTIAVISDYAVIQRSNGKMGLYDSKTGHQILSDEYNTIQIKSVDRRMRKYATNFFEVNYEGKYGAYDENGLCVVPTKYMHGITYCDRCYIVTNPKSYNMGVYSDKGDSEPIVPVEYKKICIKYGIIIGSKRTVDGYKKYAFDNSGKPLFMDNRVNLQKGFDQITAFEDAIMVENNGLKALYKKDGKTIITRLKTRIALSNNFILAKDDVGKYGALALDGTQIIPHEYDDLVKLDDDYIKGRYGNTECLFYKDGTVMLRRGLYKLIEKEKYGISLIVTVTASDGKNKFHYELRGAEAIYL